MAESDIFNRNNITEVYIESSFVKQTVSRDRKHITGASQTQQNDSANE